MTMNLYLDESGNTGTNWSDSSQPYFVYGGWLIADDYCVAAINKMNEIFSFSHAAELKSKYILAKKVKYLYEMVNIFI